MSKILSEVASKRTGSKNPNYGKQRRVECPHCGKIGGVANMTRYHFDNCKSL